MGNKSYADIVGIGDICVEINTGYTLKLKDVRHILDMRLNLISISVLDKEVMKAIQATVNGNSLKDRWCLLEGRFVAHFTRLKYSYAGTW